MNYSEIKNILTSIEDPVLKLETVMDLGNHIEAVPGSALCTEISGCASRVQICREGNRFYGTADSALVRGVVAIIISMVQGKTPDEIKEINLRDEFEGLNLNLGAGRLNGVASMIDYLENL